MDFINEYALLFAVSLPVVAIVGIQVFLFVAGERSTLLVPGLSRYPSIECGTSASKPMADVAPASFDAAVVAESSNDEMERLAA